MLGQFSKFSPDTLKGYLTFSGANARTTVLGEKGRQLISIAVAVTTRRDGCIAFCRDVVGGTFTCVEGVVNSR
jgi:alkylhydroperoxidase/carboxymuconolactone decarboxylase family protein YurZ